MALSQFQINQQVLQAASDGRADELKRLAAHYTLNLEVLSNQPEEEDLRPLHLASWAGHTDVVRWLLEKNALRETAAQGRHAVHWAAVGGHTEVLKVLKEWGCNICAFTSDMSTALHLAADYGNVEAAKWLVANGVSVVARNNQCCTAKDVARDAGNKAIVTFLQEKQPLYNKNGIVAERLLGEGSFGEVYLARDNSNQRFVLKTINLGRLSERSKSFAHNEKNVLESLEHINIVGYWGGGLVDGDLLIYMEYCDGGDLGQYIQRKTVETAIYNDSHVRHWAQSMSLALEYIHEQHIIHCDVKPHNIFLMTSGVVKLGDFGLAQTLELTSGGTVPSQAVRGTPAYMSPEMKNQSVFGTKTDMWSLGCSLYELITLQRDFLNIQIHLLSPTNMELNYIIESLLRQDPNKRFSATDVLSFLGR